MSGPSIILDPKLMFYTLQDLQEETLNIKIALYGISSVLQDVASLTYAIGFGALIKKAETDINHSGQAAVAANNAFNTTCKEVVNQLVDKFATEGAKSNYQVSQFEAIHLKTTAADRAKINPQSMKNFFQDIFSKVLKFKDIVLKMQETYMHTKAFWVGASADKARQNFISKVVPVFDDLVEVLINIYYNGLNWIDESVKFEASLVP